MAPAGTTANPHAGPPPDGRVVGGGHPRAPLAGLPLHQAAKTDAEVLEARLCVVAARMHAVEAELVGLLADFDDHEAWAGVGIRSVGQWASINLGIAARRASAQATAGRRLRSLPAVEAAAAGGGLGWDKVRLVTSVAEPASEGKWLGLATEMSVTQLARVVGAYRRASEADDRDAHDNRRERRGIWLFDQPDGLVRVTGLLEADDAAVLRAALTAMEEHLYRGPGDAPNDAPPQQAAPGRSDGPDDRHDTPGAEAASPGVPHPTEASAERNGESADHPNASGEPDDRHASRGPNGQDGDSYPTEAPPPPPPPPPEGAGPEARGRAWPATPDEVDPTGATRAPWAARRADALVALARNALTVGPAVGSDADHTEVVVVVDAGVLAAVGGSADVGRSHLLGGSAVPTATARRLACDSRLRPLLADSDGNPLHIGRSRRTVNKRLRRALWVRDGGCAFPGCTTTAHTQAHHIEHWADKGETELANLVLLCRHHHRLHHEGGYTVRLRGDLPAFYRPNGTRIVPPHLGETADQSHDVEPRVTHHTTRARSGGTNQWSLPHTLDGLLTAG